MSNIAVAIEGLLEATKPTMNATELSERTGIERSQISRIRNGYQVWVSAEDLLKFAAAFCRETKSKRFVEVHSKLLYARLRDECSGPGAQLIDITLLSDAAAELREDAVKYQPVLAPSLQQDLDIIARHIEGDRNVRDLISSVAKLCRRTPLSAPGS